MGYEPLDDFVRIGMQSPPAPGEHPEPETLLAFQAGELPGTSYAQVRQHVADCRTCRECVQDLAAIPDLESEDVTRSDSALKADWADLMARLSREGIAVAPPRPASPWATLIDKIRRALRACVDFRVPLPIAAACAGVAVGVVVWQHQARPPQLDTAGVAGNLLVVEVPADHSLRSAQQGQEWLPIEVPPGRERLVLLFALLSDDILRPAGARASTEATPPAPGAMKYRLEVTREGEQRPMLSIPDLEPDAERTLVLSLPRGALPAGRYVAHAFAAGPDPVRRYFFEFVYK